MNWILACSNEWDAWAEQWIQETSLTDLTEDWESKRYEEGAQATFVGCWLTTNSGGNTTAPWNKPEDFSAITATLSTLSRRIQRVTDLVKFTRVDQKRKQEIQDRISRVEKELSVHLL